MIIHSFTPITRKGKNKVSNVQQIFPDWNGFDWVEIDQKDQVSFSNRMGPWVLVRPHVQGDGVEDLCRWISIIDDENFKVD